MAKYNGYMATIVWMDHYNCNCHNTYSLHKEQKKVIVKIFSGIKRMTVVNTVVLFLLKFN